MIQDFQEPSADDASLMDTIKGFANTTDAISFVKAYSETPGNDNFIFKGAQPQATDSLFNLGVGVVVGPYEEGGYYKISKVQKGAKLENFVLSNVRVEDNDLHTNHFITYEEDPLKKPRE